MMSRPVRTTLNIDSMVSVIGIPRKFVRAKVSDIYADSPSRAKLKQFVEDYVNNIGNSIGKQYKIKWVYVEDTSTPGSDVGNKE